MTRRGFASALVVLAACLGPFGLTSAADAQQPASPRRVGVLLAAWLPEEGMPQAFRQGLLDTGYSEGRDLVIEWRSANGDYARIPELAADLVRRKVDVIVVDSTQGANALKHATAIIPIVMTSLADPVGSGLVANLASPGGNVTGLTIMTTELSAKRLQLLKEALPQVARVAVLWNPDTGYSSKVIEELKAAAASLSIELKLVATRTPEEFDAAFSAMRQAHAQALYVIEDSFLFLHRTTVIKLASQARLPTIWAQKTAAQAGAFMSYGANFRTPDIRRLSD